jgi:hypothetical protein
MSIFSDGQHLKTWHKNDQILVCMQLHSKCGVVVLADGTPEERQTLGQAAKRALKRLNDIFDGHFSETCNGLQIQIGTNLTEGGGISMPAQNKILLDRKKMLLSLVDAEKILADVLDPGDWTSVMSEQEAAAAGSCLEYNLVHEVGHILAQDENDTATYHRVDKSQSPTKYGRQPDRFSDKKDHEAFAEGFTYVVYSRPVSKAMQVAVQDLLHQYNH